MSALDDLAGATARLEELAHRIQDAAGRPQPEIEELARQASDLSAAVADLIPRAIAEAEAAARGGDPPAPQAADASGGPAAVVVPQGTDPGASAAGAAVS